MTRSEQTRHTAGMMLAERTLLLVKPDGVMRGLVGEILKRVETAGFKIVALKLLQASPEQLDRHFPRGEQWLVEMGAKTLSTYREYGIDPFSRHGTDEPVEIGRMIKGWLYDYYQMDPVVAALLEGLHAVSALRKVVGDTLPYRALPGTIRGDLALDAPDFSNLVGSPVKNLVHASGSIAEAEQEINCWFAGEELCMYRGLGEELFLTGRYTIPGGE